MIWRPFRWGTGCWCAQEEEITEPKVCTGFCPRQLLLDKIQAVWLNLSFRLRIIFYHIFIQISLRHKAKNIVIVY